MKLKLLSVAIILLIALSAQSQDTNKNPYAGRPFKDRVFFGGDLGLSFGTITYIRIAPVMGYMINPKLSAGAGISFQYWNDDRFVDSEQTIWGLNTFARYFVIESLFLQTDFEYLNLEAYNFSGNDVFTSRVNVPVWWVGAGYSQRSGRTGFFIGFFYDLIQDVNSPYANDYAIRVGGFVGL